MTATEFLKKQHREAMQMIVQLEKRDGEKLEGESLTLFGKLKSNLVFHTLVEEQIFYHTLANLAETKDLVREAFSDHRTVDRLLVQLCIPNDNWRKLLKELKREIAHHVDQEENDLFPRAEHLLGHKTLKQMGWQMEQVKKGKSAYTGERHQHR